MATAPQILFACGPGHRLPNGLSVEMDKAIRLVQRPYPLAKTHGQCQTLEAAAVNSVLNFFWRLLAQCGSGNPARPTYRVLFELIVSDDDFQRIRTTGNANVGEDFRPIAYSVTIGFTHDGYDAFSSQLESEISKRMTHRGHREPAPHGSHQVIQSFRDLRRLLSYSVNTVAGAAFRVSADEPRDPGHLLEMLDPKKPLDVLGASRHQRGTYLRSLAEEPGEDAPCIWQAPYSTSPGGVNPLVYGFMDEALPWNLSGDGNLFNRVALIGTRTHEPTLKKYAAMRATVEGKRRIKDWDTERDGPFERFFAGTDPSIGSVGDPRLSVPVMGPASSHRGTSRVAQISEPRRSEELVGHPSLGSIRRETERQLDLVAPDTLPALYAYFDQVDEIVQTADGGIVPPSYSKRHEWGHKLTEELEKDTWARGFFDKCETLPELVNRIQLCMAKFLGLSAAQVAFGFGVVFCGQVLPMLTMSPMLHVFCRGKAQAGKSKVAGDMLSLVFRGGVSKIDSVSANGHNVDDPGDRVFRVVDEALTLDPAQLEQWKTGLSDGLVTRQRPEKDEETGKWVKTESYATWSALTLATANRPWGMKGSEKDEEGMAAFLTRLLVITMPNQRGLFSTTTSPHIERGRLALQKLVQDATDMAPLNTAGLLFGCKLPLSIFYSFLRARRMPGFGARRRDMFESVVFGVMQLRMYLETRGLTRHERYAYWMYEGFYRVDEIAFAYKIFSEVDQTHVEEIVFKAMASLIDFQREYSEGELVGISVQTSECGGYIALPSTYSTNRRALQTLATAVLSSVPEEAQRKIPDNDSILRMLETMVNEGGLKVTSVNSRPRYGITPASLSNIRLPADRAIISMLFKISADNSIPQITMDEQRMLLPESVLDAMTSQDMDAWKPSVKGAWRKHIEKHGLSALRESIARLEACRVFTRRQTEYMASYVLADEDTTPAKRRQASVFKPGYNVIQGSKVKNIIVFDRSIGDRQESGSKTTPGDRVADDFISLCSRGLHNTEVVGICRFYGDSQIPPRSTIRKPSGQPVIVDNPYYSGDIDLDDPDGDDVEYLVDPKLKKFDLSKFPNLDEHTRRRRAHELFPKSEDPEAMMEALREPVE